MFGLWAEPKSVGLIFGLGPRLATPCFEEPLVCPCARSELELVELVTSVRLERGCPGVVVATQKNYRGPPTLPPLPTLALRLCPGEAGLLSLRWEEWMDGRVLWSLLAFSTEARVPVYTSISLSSVRRSSGNCRNY